MRRKFGANCVKVDESSSNTSKWMQMDSGWMYVHFSNSILLDSRVERDFFLIHCEQSRHAQPIAARFSHYTFLLIDLLQARTPVSLKHNNLAIRLRQRSFKVVIEMDSEVITFVLCLANMLLLFKTLQL